jgi:hypothetical protein
MTTLSVWFHCLFLDFGCVELVSMFLMTEEKMVRMRKGEIGSLEVMRK